MKKIALIISESDEAVIESNLGFSRISEMPDKLIIPQELFPRIVGQLDEMYIFTSKYLPSGYSRIYQIKSYEVNK